MNDPKDANSSGTQANPEQNGQSTTETVAPDALQEAPLSEPDPFAVLENLHAENASLKDKILRTLADMENLRRRTEKEVADAKAYGMAAFARDMLQVGDNIRRGLDSIPADTRATAGGPFKALIEGVELTERDFLSRLSRYGVRKIEPQGAKFDPNMHEALYEVPDDNVPGGTVVQVMEPGYAIGDRVLRPARVGVSKGGPRMDTADKT